MIRRQALAGGLLLASFCLAQADYCAALPSESPQSSTAAANAVSYPGANAEGIDVRFEEISEPAIANMLREPVDLSIVGEHRLLELARANEPTPPRILDQRIVVGPPAKRIVVQVLFLMEQQMTTLEIALNVLVAVLDPTTLVVGGVT